jgi:hypothetical protein
MADTPDVQQPVTPSPDDQAAAATAGPQPSQATPDLTQPAVPTQANPVVPPQANPVVPPQANPAAVAPATAGDKVKHVLGDIFQTLAGGKKIVYAQGPNGPVKTYEDLKPGEMARGILAAAITGLASGYDPARRGHGPAMSSAFSAGFQGEQERQDKQQQQQQQEAQQTFVNKNASDELLMKKQRFAQEQQQSILDYQKTQQMMQQAAVRSKQEGIVFDQGQRAYFDNLDAKYNGEIAKGGKPIDDPKNPGQPLVFWDRDTMQQYANEHGKELVNPGEFDTKIMSRPDGSWVIMKTPLAEKEKRSWRFAEMDPKNPSQPLMKDGKVVPSGIKDETGQVIPPTIMSGEEYGNKIAELDAHKKSAASAEDLLSQAAERRALAAKNAQFAAAQDQLAKAGGDINAVDVANGKAVVNDKNRGMMISRLTMAVKDQEAAIQKAQTEFDNALPSEQTPEKRAQIEEAKEQAKSLRAQLSSVTTAQTTPAQNMTRSLLKRFDNDPQKAAEYFDKQAKEGKYAGNLLPQDIDTIRKNLIAANQEKQNQAQATKAAGTAAAQDEFGPSSKVDVLANPANLQAAQTTIQQHLQSGTSFTDVQREIKSASNLSRADKTKLLDYVASIPFNVTMKDGSTVSVGPDQIDSFLRSNPGATVAAGEQSKYQQQTSKQQKEEQQDKDTQRETDINSQS